MTEEQLREIEVNANREDIPALIAYIRRLQAILEQCKEILK
jgi:hypothetical protein